MGYQSKSLGVVTLTCIECGRQSDRNERWRAFLTDDEPPEVVTYCEDCAEREFGDGA